MNIDFTIEEIQKISKLNRDLLFVQVKNLTFDKLESNYMSLMNVSPRVRAALDPLKNEVLHLVEQSKTSSLGFEYVSPKIRPSNKALTELRDLLLGLLENGIVYNENCGFHIHFSIPNRNKNEMVWDYLSLLSDSVIFELATQMKEYVFLDEDYASEDLIKNLLNTKYIGNESKFNNLLIGLIKDRYSFLSLTEIGTFEWRSPRGFMKDSESISSFIKHFANLLKRVSYVFSNNEKITWAGETLYKKDFIKNIELNITNDDFSFSNKDPDKDLNSETINIGTLKDSKIKPQFYYDIESGTNYQRVKNLEFLVRLDKSKKFAKLLLIKILNSIKNKETKNIIESILLYDQDRLYDKEYDRNSFNKKLKNKNYLSAINILYGDSHYSFLHTFLMRMLSFYRNAHLNESIYNSIYKTNLKESILRSEFYFGFEIEGYINVVEGPIRNYDDLIKFINDNFTYISKGNIVEDISLDMIKTIRANILSHYNYLLNRD